MAVRRPTFKAFKKAALNNPEVKAAYDELTPAHALKRNMIAMRKAKGFTQEDVANFPGTKNSSISRSESVNSDNSPRLATVEEYARVLGYRLKIEFEKSKPSP